MSGEELVSYPLVDARCTHPHCPYGDAYRMIGTCTNCGFGPVIVLITVTHEKPFRTDCPKCRVHAVRCDRLAADHEIPM